MEIKKILLDLFFPKTCTGCGLEGKYLCLDCRRKIKFLEQQHCPVCEQKETWGSCCPACHNSHLNGAWSALDYNQKLISKLIKHMKYNGNKEAAGILSQLLIERLQSLINLSLFSTINKIDFSNPLLIPVPLSRRRFRERGFNQAELIAQSLAEYFDWELSLKLKRHHKQKTQASLNKQARQKNLNGIFFLEENNFSGRNVFIIDDVITTGTTISECAKTIASANPKSIWGISLAHG